MKDIDVVVDEEEFANAGEHQRRKLCEFAKRLRVEPFLGDRIPKRLVPRSMKNLPNLFRLELPEGWRALYAVASSPATGVQVRILWIGSHSRYERLLGYT